MKTGSEGGRGVAAATPTKEVIAGLNHLLQLDHDAIASYEIAIEHLDNRDHALQIEGFKREHERHIRGLNRLIIGLGGAPINEPHTTAPLKQAILRIASTGGDVALLTAWRTNELHTMTTYDSYARRAVFWPADAKRLIDENALDEEKHYQWAVALTSGGDATELHLVNRFRESVVRARHLGGQAQERLSHAAEGARLRAADSLIDIAGRLDEIATRDAGVEGLRGKAAQGARRVARGLDSTAAYLREGGDEDARTTVETQIRANPARSLIATFAIGFVLGRILR